jgi:small subunit ribosomal protein S17
MAKTITGVVKSKKTDKTIVVTEHVRLTHPLYRKQYTVTKHFMAHDEKNEAHEGDKVVIVESRPISARKHFKLQQIVQKAGVKHVESENPLAEITGTDKAQEQPSRQAHTKIDKDAKNDKPEASPEEEPAA